MDEQKYWPGQFSETSKQYEPTTETPVRETTLPESLRIIDVQTSLEGLETEGVAMVRYLPQGYATPTWIHLKDDGGKDYTLVVNPITGRTAIHDERVEMKRDGF